MSINPSEHRFESTPSFAEQWLRFRSMTRSAHDLLLFPILIKELGPLQNRRVLDAGCGDGSFMEILAGQQPSELLGLEVNAPLVDVANTKLKEGGRVHVQDVTAVWNLPTASVDVMNRTCR